MYLDGRRALRLRIATLAWVALGIGAVAGPGHAASPAAPAPAAAAQSPAAPSVTVEPESQDLGVVGLGEDAVAEVLVRNAGGAPLALSVPVLARGTAVEGVVPELAPGQSARLRLRIDTLRAEAQPEQRWTLVTSDPGRPRVPLTVRLEVRPFLLVRPGRARYITVQKAREGTIAQTVGAADGASFRVLRVETPLPDLRATFREASPAERRPEWTGSQWRVETTLAADAPVGALTGMVVVHTDHPRQRRAFVLLSGFVRPILAVTPPEARVGDLERRRTSPVRLEVRNFAEEPIQVTAVATDVAAVRVELRAVEAGRSWRVELLPAPGAPLGPFEGTLVLRTASSKLPTLEVPLSGRIVEAAPGPPPRATP